MTSTCQLVQPRRINSPTPPHVRAATCFSQRTKNSNLLILVLRREKQRGTNQAKLAKETKTAQKHPALNSLLKL